jgi:hypothetical protein
MAKIFSSESQFLGSVKNYGFYRVNQLSLQFMSLAILVTLLFAIPRFCNSH